MRISEAYVSLWLTPEGDEVLERAGVPKAEAVGLRVRENDHAGLWARVTRGGAEYLLLIRWEHVLSVEIPERQPRPRGIAR